MYYLLHRVDDKLEAWPCRWADGTIIRSKKAEYEPLSPNHRITLIGEIVGDKIIPWLFGVPSSAYTGVLVSIDNPGVIHDEFPFVKN